MFLQTPSFKGLEGFETGKLFELLCLSTNDVYNSNNRLTCDLTQSRSVVNERSLTKVNSVRDGKRLKYFVFIRWVWSAYQLLFASVFLKPYFYLRHFFRKLCIFLLVVQQVQARRQRTSKFYVWKILLFKKEIRNQIDKT